MGRWRLPVWPTYARATPAMRKPVPGCMELQEGEYGMKVACQQHM